MSERSGDDRSERRDANNGATPKRSTRQASHDGAGEHRRSGERDEIGARKSRGREANEGAEERAREPNADHTTSDGEQRALGEQLPRQVGGRRADGATNRHLASASRRAEKQQVADVRARQHEKQRHRGGEREQRRARVARHQFRQRVNLRAKRVRADEPELVGIVREECLKFLTRCFRRHVRCEPPDDVKASVLGRDPELDAARIIQTRRRNANHGHAPTHLGRAEVPSDHR